MCNITAKDVIEKMFSRKKSNKAVINICEFSLDFYYYLTNVKLIYNVCSNVFCANLILISSSFDMLEIA